MYMSTGLLFMLLFVLLDEIFCFISGVTALAALVQVDPKYALDYQLIVIDCLDDPDETLKRKVNSILLHKTPCQ